MNETGCEVLNGIAFSFDVPVLMRKSHIEPDSEDAVEFAALADQVRRLGRPKALVRECFIRAKDEDTVTIEAVVFRSRALRLRLGVPERVFAYVATCGSEVDLIKLPPDDFLKRYWLDTMKSSLLHTAMSHLSSHLECKYALGKTSGMSPGAGDASVWPIEQQRELFSLLGDVNGTIGVELTDSFLMVPNKSVSGIKFQTEVEFKSCQLCKREICPSRSAPFDPGLWATVNS